MFASTLRGMVAHKVRLLLTTASIALGVAFLAGTLILTDTMSLAFTQLFGKIGAGTDAVVRTEAAYKQAEGSGLTRGPISASVLDQVKAVDGVRVAEGSVTGYALLTDTEGKAVLTKGGAPTQGYSMPRDVTLRGDVNLSSGHAPRGPHEVVIDATSAEKHDIPLGSDINILFRGPTQEFTVVGTVEFGGEKNLGGSTSAYFDTATAQKVLGSTDTFDAINVRAAAGVSDKELAQRLDAAVPDTAEAVTGAHVAKENSDAVAASLKMVTIMFMIFAGIALFVGSFIIWNTFTMIVTQRSREIALLRAVGATRRQVLKNLLGEALLLGVGASAVGVALGIGVAKGLNALMAFLGFTLPTTSTQIEPRTIWVSILVGTLVTLVAALVPARRATKVLPVEALREATPGSRPPSKKRLVIGALTSDRWRRCRAQRAVRRRQPQAARARRAAGSDRRHHAGTGGRPATRSGDRLAAAAPRRARRPGPAERDAQPASYGVHGDCSDDRPHPGHQHGRLLGVAEGLVLRPDQELDQRGPVPGEGQQRLRGLQPLGNQGRGCRSRGPGCVGDGLGPGPDQRCGHGVQLAGPRHRRRDVDPQRLVGFGEGPGRRWRPGGEEDGHGVAPHGRLHRAGRVRRHREARPQGGGDLRPDGRVRRLDVPDQHCWPGCAGRQSPRQHRARPARQGRGHR